MTSNKKNSPKNQHDSNIVKSEIDISDFTIAYSKFFDIPNSKIYLHEEKIKKIFDNFPTLYSLIIE